MASWTPRTFVVAAAAVALTATLATAQEYDLTPPHVRGENQDTNQLLRELVVRSPSAREMVDVLEQSDVVVYVRYRWYATSTLRGRIGFLTTDPHRRILGIEISSRYTHLDQLTALGHELQHAVEIAEMPTVFDAPTLAALYQRIGEAMGRAFGSETYETQAAANAGRRVRHELTMPAVSADAADADRN